MSKIIQKITGWSWKYTSPYNGIFKNYCLSFLDLGIVAKEKQMLEDLGIKGIMEIEITVSTYKPKGKYFYQGIYYYFPCPLFAPFDYAFVTPQKFFLRVGDIQTRKPHKEHIEYWADKEGVPLEHSSLWYDAFDVGEQEISDEEAERAIAKWKKEGKLHCVDIMRWNCTCGKGHAPRKVWITVYDR